MRHDARTRVRWLVLAALLAGRIFADQTWNNSSGDLSWLTAANWSGLAVPTSTDRVFINGNCTAATPVVITNATTWNSELELGSLATDAGYLLIQSGVLTNSSTTNERYIGKAGTGWLRMTGGTLYAGRYLVLGKAAGSAGTCLLDGGDVWANWAVHIGDAGTGTVIQTGGTMTGPDGNYQFTLGHSTGGVGRVWLSNGVMRTTGTQSAYVGFYGTGELHVRGGTFFPVRFTTIGRYASSTGYVEVASGALTNGTALYVGDAGQGMLLVTGGWVSSGSGSSTYIGNSVGGHGMVIVSNGTMVAGTGTGDLQVGAGGQGELFTRGGTMKTFRHCYVGYSAGSTGSVTHESGTLSIGYDLHVGYGGLGTMAASNAFTCRGLYIGELSSGTGRVDIAPVAVTLGDGSASYVGCSGSGVLALHGATLTAGGTSSDLIVRRDAAGTGVLQGWGTFNAGDQLINNGVIVADGEGTDHDLNLSALDGSVGNQTWSNPIENTTSNGWYAVNHGRLLLASAVVPATNTAVWWAENQASDSDGTIDLVNSVAATFTGITGSAGTTNLTISLLAPDRSDVPAPNGAAAGGSFIGVWNLALNKPFASAGLQFRYNNAAAGRQSLRLCRYATNTAAWVQVPASALAGYRLEATGVSALGFYAVAAMPIRGTVVICR